MPPKKAVSTTGTVEPEGVPYSVNLASKLVVVGTGVVSNSERDTFKASQKADAPSLDDQIRGRPKWQSIAAAQLAKSAAGSANIQSAPQQQLQEQQPFMQPSHPEFQASAETQEAYLQLARRQTASTLAVPGYRECWVCHTSNKECAPAGCARIGSCSCGVEMCNAPCRRRGVCPSHARWKLTGYCMEPDPAMYPVYAEVAAGIGCQCACCLRFGDWIDMCYNGWQLHSPRGPGLGDEEDAHEERREWREALASAANPTCHVQDILIRCDMCEGNCGTELYDGSMCGSACS